MCSVSISTFQGSVHFVPGSTATLKHLLSCFQDLLLLKDILHRRKHMAGAPSFGLLTCPRVL